MKILQLSAYCDPEQVSSSHLSKDLMEVFSENDFYIEKIVPTPTRGISKEVREKYKKIKYETQYEGHVIIHRFSMFREKKNAIQRALRYFLVQTIQFFKAGRAKDIDLIYASSTPPTQGLMCGMLKKKLKVPFIYILQDIFPDSLVNAKMTKKGSLLWKVGRKIEDFSYRRADKIVVISESFKKNIMDKGVPEEKIEVISNWINPDECAPVKREQNTLISEFQIDPDKFLVVYAGNFGAVQGADVVLDAAERLKEHRDIQFVIFGGGSEFSAACERAGKMDNVWIHKLLPAERVPEVYSLGDVSVITCKKGTGNAGMPSKTWSIMACNTPIIASFDTDSDLAKVIREANAGLCVEPENAEALAEAILAQYRLKGGEKVQLFSPRDYVCKHASKGACTAKYVTVIKEVTESR